MPAANQGLQAQKKKPFSVMITTEMYQNLISQTLGDPERVKRFVAAISSAVAVNPVLQECEAGSILTAALLGESMNLSPSPQFGQYYMVPFDVAEKDATGKTIYVEENGKSVPKKVKKAQFILGYKGYMQLAQNSGQLRKLVVLELKEGELKHYDPLNEEIAAVLIQDFDAREKAPTVGYYAFFELANGFRKPIFWTFKQMLAHADKYSPAFSAKKYLDLVEGRIAGLTLEMIQQGAYISDKELWKTANSMSSFWYKDFDGMAKKTMLRQLISKGGCPMSTEMIATMDRDGTTAAIGAGGSVVIDQPLPLDANTPPYTPPPTAEGAQSDSQVDFDEI